MPRSESNRLNARLQNIPLALLIDESSASASEIVSGAIQDWDRGTIIGRRSFGKGLVEQEFPLVDGSRIRLTIARYHTPSGRVIQTPYKQGDKDGYEKKYIERLLSNERFNKDSISIDKSLEFKTLRLGRTVYGGGGIVPDEFIAIDTTYYSMSYLKSVNSGALTEFVQGFVDSHREELIGEYPSYNDFATKYNVSEQYINLYLNDSKKRGIEYTKEEIERSLPTIKKHLKALIIRNLYGLEKYLQYSNLSDNDVNRALEILRSKRGL